jgi:hypothetical protein
MVLVTTLTRNEDNTNRFMQWCLVQKLQPTNHTQTSKLNKIYESSVLVQVYSNVLVAPKPTINKDEQCWLYKRPFVLVQVYSNVLATNAKQGSPIQNLLWPNFKAELTSSVNSALTGECGFPHTIQHGSQDTGEINFVVSSITMYKICDVYCGNCYIKIAVWS